MSRRSATTITLSVRIPLPPGARVIPVIEDVRIILREHARFKPFREQIIVKLSKRETVYL